MRKLITICAAVLMFLAITNIASAGLEIRVDFSTDNGTVANWTGIHRNNRNATTSNLVDFNTGLPTAVSTTGVSWGSFSYNEPWSGTVGWVESNASNDGWAGGSSGVASTQTFAGLDSSKQYMVEVVSAYGSANLGTVTVTINSAYADTNHDNNMAGNVSANWNQRNAYNNEDWMIWSSITPDANGNLVLTLKNDGTNWGIMNAVRITEVPEPASMALLSLGALVLRRKRK